MRYIQTIGISVQANLPDSDAIYTKYWCEYTYVCPVFNRQRADDALARRFVFARRASVAELGGAAKLRGRIRRRDWPRSSATRGACR